MPAHRRQTGKAAQLVAEIRQLRLDVILATGDKQRILDYMSMNLRAPDEPEIHVVFQPIVMWDMRRFLLDPDARCCHAFGGPEPAANEPEVFPPCPASLLR